LFTRDDPAMFIKKLKGLGEKMTVFKVETPLHGFIVELDFLYHKSTPVQLVVQLYDCTVYNAVCRGFAVQL